MKDLISDLEVQMKKIDKMKDNIDEESPGLVSAKQNNKFLEEIVVPPLEMLKDEPPKKKKEWYFCPC